MDQRYLLTEQLCFSAYSLNLAINRFYKPLLDDLGITYPQYLVLSVLWETDSVTIGTIAKQLRLETSTLTPVLKRLGTEQLISRQRNPDSDREVIITLTEKGRELDSKARSLNVALGKACADSISVSSLNDAMRSMTETIVKATRASNLDD